MPHQVVKCSVTGSVGDLAKITDAIEKMNINIVGIGGAETAVPPSHVGVIALLLDPDKDNMDTILATLRNLELDTHGRRPQNVEAIPDIQVLLDDTPGQLKKAAEAVGDINIETVISLGTRGNKAVVSLGFQPDKWSDARNRLTNAADVDVVADPHNP
jgi:hypothetical protein